MKFPLAILCLCLASCQTMETVTTSTSPDGVVTQTVKRPIQDPFDAQLGNAMVELMGGDR